MSTLELVLVAFAVGFVLGAGISYVQQKRSGEGKG